jgi:lipopolysaccharide transport system ATP-binding protein
MSEAVIQFEHVSKQYPLYHHITGGIKHFLLNLPKALKSLRKARFEALHDISFEVLEGETLGVIGRNGAGKSTMLSLMAGVLKPSSGRIAVKRRVSPLLELGGGFHPELSGRENIVLNGVLLGMGRREVVGKMEEIISFSELAVFIDQPIRTYSSGMLSRLGFSVVAHLDPQLLLIDEVLAVGDIDFQKKCLNKLAQFKKSGVTMVIVSHALQDIERVCDKVVWLENHVTKMIGSPAAVVAEYVKQAK